MADLHKALANALKNLKGIHGSGEKKKPMKEVIVEGRPDVGSGAYVISVNEESIAGIELQKWKRKKAKYLGVSSSGGSLVPDASTLSATDVVDLEASHAEGSQRVARGTYRDNLMGLPRPADFSKIVVARYKVMVTWRVRRS